MTREKKGISSSRQAVRVPISVESLVMMSNDRSDLGVVVDLRKDALADLAVRLHEATLLERERTRLLEKAGRQTDLSDVVHEPAKMNELLLSV